MDKVINESRETIWQAVETVRRLVLKLPKPEVFPLDQRSAIAAYAVVAVDTGQSLFNGFLQYLGISIFQVATSEEDSPTRSCVFYVDPHLTDQERRNQICQRFDALLRVDTVTNTFASIFTQRLGFRKIYDEGVMPKRCFEFATELVSFLRELLEWAELYHSAQRLRELLKVGQGIVQPVLLRDGVLRFNAMGKGHSDTLREMFKELEIPIIGITKQSVLLRNPIVTSWLAYHQVPNFSGPFAIRLTKDFFERIGYKLQKYYGESEIRFGGPYVLVRFDPLPGSRNLFVVDVPDYIWEDWEKVLVLLSGVGYQATATVYPVPGYPLALRKAHEKVCLTNEKVRFLEAALRRVLPSDIYSFLKSLGL